MPSEAQGVVLVDKPGGMTSFDVVKAVRWVFRSKSAGHTGTLDPMATGLLPICIGDATRIAGFVTDGDKEYVGTVRFGATTDTLDAEGTVVATGDATGLTEGVVRAAIEALKGEVTLPPPMYSARKVDGKRLYELARAGVEVERTATTVTIREAEFLGFSAPDAVMRIRCSKGTYIRSLADHLGRTLGPGAHLAALRRTGVGRFGVGESIALDALKNLRDTPDALSSLLRPVEDVLQELPGITLDARTAASVAFGNALTPELTQRFATAPLVAGTHLRLLDPDGFVVAVGLAQADGRVTLARVLRARTGPGNKAG